MRSLGVFLCLLLLMAVLISCVPEGRTESDSREPAAESSSAVQSEAASSGQRPLYSDAAIELPRVDF